MRHFRAKAELPSSAGVASSPTIEWHTCASCASGVIRRSHVSIGIIGRSREHYVGSERSELAGAYMQHARDIQNKCKQLQTATTWLADKQSAGQDQGLESDFEGHFGSNRRPSGITTAMTSPSAALPAGAISEPSRRAWRYRFARSARLVVHDPAAHPGVGSCDCPLRVNRRCASVTRSR